MWQGKSDHYIPMAVSILLLTLFLVYWLNTEYQKTALAIVKDVRSDKLQDIFIQMDSILHREDIGVHKKGSAAMFSIDDTSSGQIRIKIDRSSDTVVTDSTRLVTEVKIEQWWSDKKGELNLGADLFELDSVNFQTQTVHISSLEILQHMSGQIAMAMILLIAVLGSFYFMHKSLKKERRLSQVQTDLMSNMSHELKTPVSTVSAALEAATNFVGRSDERLRREYLDIAKLEIKRLDHLVDKTISMSLLDNKSYFFDYGPVDLKSIVVDVMRVFQTPSYADKVNLRLEARGSSFKIRGDKVHMTNVLYNLIDNAIKYCPDAPIVTIVLSERDELVEMTIRDNGPGIPNEYQSHIFDKFFRVPQGDRHNIKGHGLGLAYVKDVVTKQSGKIALASDPGSGTTFIIQMPKFLPDDET